MAFVGVYAFVGVITNKESCTLLVKTQIESQVGDNTNLGESYCSHQLGRTPI
jgi:hypothetical protein